MRKYVISCTFTSKKGKEVRRAPKIQRLVTPPRPAEEEGEEGCEAGERAPEQGGRGIHEACGAAPRGAEGGEEEFDQQEGDYRDLFR